MFDWFKNKLKGWRTMIVNGLLTIMPILELTEVIAVLPDNWLPWYALGIALSNIWLRTITTSPVGKKF